MPSISEWRQPYLLSNLDLVTESLTLIAGNSSLPSCANWYSRCTPVVVSSVTPLIRAAIRVKRRGSSRSERAQQRQDDPVLLVVGARRDRGPRRRPRTRRPCARAASRRRRRRGSCSGRSPSGQRQRLLGAPPVLLERLALPGEHRDALRVLGRAVGADDDRRRRMVLGREDVAAGPAHLGAQRRPASRSAPRSGSSCAASR